MRPGLYSRAAAGIRPGKKKRRQGLAPEKKGVVQK
jgi:hypothetical protein